MADIGFTTSLFIAGQAFAVPEDFAAAKIAIFGASSVSGLIGACVLWSASRKVFTPEARLARSLVALHRAPDEPWPLARMARVAGMSRSAFAEAFKTATGTTPAAYLTDWRLTLAASMLDARQGDRG